MSSGKAPPLLPRARTTSTQKKARPWQESVMQFCTQKEDYNVAEFYDNFGHLLPKVVMVNQGFCGDIIQDTFDREQVMRLHTVSKQKRVIAKFVASGQKRLVSIPVTYGAKMCVLDKKSKPGPEQPLAQIVEQHKLPVFVVFPANKTISIGNQNVSSNWIPKMELVQTFDEMYFLSNFIIEGVLTTEVTPVPLYLKQLRLVEVTGIQGQPREKWNGYREMVSVACEKIHYDLGFGNSEVAVYDPKANYEDTMYSYVEPTVYSPMHSFFKKPVLGNPTYTITEEPEESAHGDVYDEITESRLERKATTNAASRLNHELKHAMDKGQSPNRALAVTTPVAPPVAPKPKPQISPSLPRGHPDLPSRQPIVKPQTEGIRRTTNEPVSYGNVATRYVQNVKETPSPQSESVVYPGPNAASSKTPEEVVPSLSGPEEVAKLSLDEVAKYLKVLHLDHYADKFRDQLIDGSLLSELDKNIFKEEFGMKTIEAIRLEKFAHSGHVPR